MKVRVDGNSQMRDWLAALFRSLRAKSEPKVNDYADLVPELSPLPWEAAESRPTKSIDTRWLLERLMAYQSPRPPGARGVFANAPALAGDLYQAGLEDDDIAWVWGESPSNDAHIALIAVMARFGMGLLPKDWIANREICCVLRDYLAGRIVGLRVWNEVCEWLYDEDVDYDDLLYMLDHLTSECYFDNATGFVKGVLPHLEARNDEMVAVIAAHLRGITTD